MDTRTVTERPVGELDAWLSEDDVFRADPATSRRHLTRHLREALRHHIATNEAYGRFVLAHGFDPDTLTVATLDQIPVLPGGIFKRAPETLRSGGGSVVDTTSSGTQGTVSRVPRDDETMMRFFASVAAGVRELMDIEHSETFVHNVGPTVEESEHLWISYVMSGVSVLHDTDFYVKGGVFELDRLVEALRSDSSEAPSVVVGPPPMLLATARHLLATEPLPIRPNRYVVAIGGWKRRAGEMVPRAEFDELAREAFGLKDTGAVRDAFNMVELNTIILECAHHRKHCPPWLYVSARDPRSLTAVAPGGTGILAYADPTARSFPGLVLSDDFGRVDRDVTCDCGIVGDVVSIDRRINRLETRGCAMKM